MPGGGGSSPGQSDQSQLAGGEEPASRCACPSGQSAAFARGQPALGT